MQSPLPGLDNREFALVAWAVLALAASLFSRSIRYSLRGVIGALFHWKLLVVLASMLAYIGLVVALLADLGLWTNGLISETVYWIVVTGSLLLFRSTTSGDDEDFFKKTVWSTLALTAVTEFLVNLRPMNLVLELVLVPVLVVLGGTLALATRRAEYRQAKGCLEVAAVFIGLALLGYTVSGMVTIPDALFTYENLLEFLVPIALTVAFVPFIYVTALLTTYGALFSRLNWKLSPNGKTRRYAKRRAIRVAHIRLSRIHRLSKGWPWRLTPDATREEVEAALQGTEQADDE
jgi:hypothetical protein